MEKLPLVSIDCITYNHAPYIRQCLEGFLMQKTNFSFEVLVHDDASNDGTADIIREYEIKYPNLIKPIYQTENQWSKGKSISGEYNFPRARGKYIALCEGDDYWLDPLKLQKQVDLLEKNKDCSLCCGGYIQRQQGKKDIERFARRNDSCFCFTLEDWGKEWLTKTLTVIFRKEALKEYQAKYLYYKYTRDIHMVYHLLKWGNGIYISDILGVYHIHQDGVCSMIPAALNAIHSYNCYQELYVVNQDSILRKLYVKSILSCMAYPVGKNHSTRKNYFREGWKLGILSDKVKLLYYYVTPLFIVHAVVKIRRCIRNKIRPVIICFLLLLLAGISFLLKNA